jgi:hypothetical protein
MAGTSPAMTVTVIGKWFSAPYPHASFEAMAAPSAKVRSLAHMMLRWTRPASGLCEKPQSLPAINSTD